MSRTPLKALVVDDEKEIRSILRRLMTRAGVEVCAEVSSGEDAVAWMAANHADLVIMDIQMPGMGGIEATRAIKASKPATQVFGFTGWGREQADAMSAAGASAVYAKTQLSELLEAIRKLGAG